MLIGKNKIISSKFDKSKFNIVSLGSACCMVQNIYDNLYSNFPLVNEIYKIFSACKTINPTCDVKLYFFIHPNYHDNPVIKEYKYIDNVELCFLKIKDFTLTGKQII